MENKHVTPPDNKDYEYALNLAFRIVRDKLAALDDIEQQCRKSGSRCENEGTGPIPIVRYLNREYRISLPDAGVFPVEGKDELPLREKVLVLHYFASAKGTPLSGTQITYRELPSGIVYIPTFNKRTIEPLLRFFSETPDVLMRASERLGGVKSDIGDAAVTITAFDRVPVTIVIWQGDEELPPQGNILLDSTVPDYLSSEDVTVLSEIITWRLVRLSKEL